MDKEAIFFGVPVELEPSQPLTEGTDLSVVKTEDYAL